VATGQGRLHFQQELRALEEQALGGLDMVVSTLDRTLEALEHQDIELASIVVHTVDPNSISTDVPNGTDSAVRVTVTVTHQGNFVTNLPKFRLCC